MDMALGPQSPVYARNRPMFLIRSTTNVISGGGNGDGNLQRSFLSNSRYFRSRIIRCTVASSDWPNRKSRRATSPKIRVTAFKGYAPRFIGQSSTKKREHHDSDEEAIDTYNRMLSTDAPERTGSQKVESTEVDSPQNASSSLTLAEVDVTEEAGLDIFDDDLPGDVLNTKSIEKMDKDEVKKEKNDVNLSKNSLELDATNEAKAKDIFEVGLAGHALSNLSKGKVYAVKETKTDGENFEVDLLGIALDNAGVREDDATDEAKSREDMIVMDLPGNSLNNATVGESDAVDEAKYKEDIFLVDLPINSLRNLALVEVDEAKAKEGTLEFSLSGTTFSCAPLAEVITDDEAKTNKDISVVSFSGTATNIDAMGVVEVIDEAGTEHKLVELDLSGHSLSNVTAGELELIDEARSVRESFGVDLSYNAASNELYGEVIAASETQTKEVTHEMSMSGLCSSNTGPGGTEIMDEASADMFFLGGDPNTAKYVAVDSTDESVVEEVNYQQQNTSLSDTSMKVNDIDETWDILKHMPMPLVGDQGPDKILRSEGESIPNLHQPEVDFHKQEHEATAFDDQNLSIVGFPKQDMPIIHLPEKDHYIVGFPKLAQSIVRFHSKDQSIVGYYRQDTSIVSVPKQTHSIVRFPKQKLSIVGFRKQDLSSVGTSREVQTKQVAIVDNLLQKDKEDIIEEASDMTTSKKVDEKHLLMIEEQKTTSLVEEQHLVKEEGISVAEVQMKMDEDELMHLLSEAEVDTIEASIIEDEEHFEVDETSMSAELGMLESQADLEPQAHQRMLQELAEKNHSLGNMLFLYPEVVKADSTIDLFLNRDLSALANEPDVLIKGAFNGWRWKPFIERLHKSDLGGDWWCCKLYIPKQAYRLDFVFFNSRTVYENNGNNDFVMQIESNMDEHLFADFLVEERKKELERLATEEAERKRQIDDQRRREEERAADEAIRAQAKAEVGMKENKLRNVLGLARTSVADVWYIEPITTGQGSTIRLYYKRSLRSLARSTEIWIHGGYNNWIDGLSFAERLAQHDEKDSEWLFTDVVIPEKAYVLDWVFADGPPGNAMNFDNNDRHDFHAILPNNKTEVEYWMEEEQRIYIRLLQERREREEAVKRKAELSAKMKAEMKEKTMRMFLVSQKHIVYTAPLEIHAGSTVDVLYNPSNTVLNGKPEVWFRCSFNRWMYPGGVLPPQKMVKAENGPHLKATVNVPADAYVMDFVFSESKEGGIYDNRNGLDYHIPIFGSTRKEPPMHIVHIAVEMAPIAKVGGLGDVVTSLSRAVQDLGHNVEVVLPKHDCLNLRCVRNLHVHESFSWGGTEIRVWFGLVEDVSVYFLEPQNGMFGVGCVYGRNDDRRFGFFCHAALEFLHQSGLSPHIIHCHDWSSAPVAWLCKEYYAQSSLANARVVFTIHNLEFGAHYVGKAMKYCDKATTVSNTYSREVSGHGAIAPHLGKFFGILNGIDPDIWDPYNDNFIPAHYTSENVVEGKSTAKRALQQKLGLQQNDVPLVGIITRLTAQKGIHLIKHAIHRILEQNGQVVLLGSAPDHRIQNDFCNLANTLHGVNYGRVRLCLTYDEPLSHLIYAGSDFILVPSIFEPCGLTQLIAMRYGSVPIVRKTGGLYDTVFDVEYDKDRARAHGLEPNGFSFDGADTNGVDYVLNRAITAWFEAREWFQSLCKRVMQQDWSWNRPALDYIELYRSASKF